MKNYLVLTALLVGMSLSLSAQKNVLPSLKFFASIHTNTPNQVTKTEKKSAITVLSEEANWAFFNNKSCKIFAELGNLGEDFWVEEMPFAAREVNATSTIIGKKGKCQTASYCTQLADFQRLFGQNPCFAGK
jgi:hypothetical protein